GASGAVVRAVAAGWGGLDPLGRRARPGRAVGRGDRAWRGRVWRRALARVRGADRAWPGPVPRRAGAEADLHWRLRRRRRALRRIAGGGPLRDPRRRAGGRDPDRIELADHLPEPVRGAPADAGKRTGTRDRGQRPAAHGARVAPVPAAGYRCAGLADAEHALPFVPHALG